MANALDTLTTSADLFNRIQAQFAAGKRIMVCTYTRATLYKPKHASMFRASSRTGDTGVYVQSGRSSVYLIPSIIQFEK